VPDDALVAETMEFAKKIAAVPRELVKVAKHTLANSAATEDRIVAAGHEFIAQVWSATQPAFGEKLAAMKARIRK
jgi:enoyl-CoA hydratase